MRQRPLSAREVLLRHSWAIVLMESRAQPGPANLHHRDAVTGCLRTAEELAAMGDDVFLPLLPPAQYPHLNEVASALLAAGYDPAAEFTFGLDVILAALDRVRSASGT